MERKIKRVELGFTPRPHQREAHDKRKRFSVLVWHRRSGKTVFSIMELILAALACTKPQGHFAYIAPFYRQAKLVAWSYLERYAAKIPGMEATQGDLTISLPNGAKIRLFGADNPDALRGLYFDGIVLDEVADMKPNVWGEIIRPALTDRGGWALFIGTPKGLNLFSELYHAALLDPDWYADLRRASDTQVIPKEELEAAKRQMTANQYSQEMECDFAAAVDNILIPVHVAREALGKVILRDSYYHAPMVLGVDVARYGDDRSVIFPRQGLAAFKPSIYRGANTMELANHVVDHIGIHKPSAVFVDEGAMGAGVIDRVRQLGYSVIGVNFGSRARDPKYRNQRSEIWSRMAIWLKEGGCLPAEESIIQDLCAPTFSFDNAANVFDLESKDDMKKRGLASPDLGDALALTFTSVVTKQSDLQNFEVSSRAGRVETDYEVI